MRKKKLLLLSSYGGYGHIAAANTLKKLLGETYDIEVVYPIKELRMFKLPAGENFYNWLISNNLNGLTNWVVRLLPAKLFANRTEKTTRLIRDHIQSKKADIVVSLIPFVNYPASEAARQCDVPFLVITTDNDLTNWVFNLEKMDVSKFKVTYGFDLETTKGLLTRKGISENAMEQLGLPLRPDFIDTEDKKTLRAKYEIPEGKNVVLIMMGGAGSRVTVKYVKALIARSMNLHVLVCAGRSRHLARKLKSLTPATGNALDVIPFTEKVHELLALSDLLLTKPGPGSINEAYALKLPILLDHTKPPLFWEQANIDLVMRDGVGACIDQIKDTPDLVGRFLFDEQTREQVLRAYEAVPENRFATAIPELIGEMLEVPATGEVVVTGRNMSRF